MRKHVCCTAVCVVCTAVLFYLHFIVYGGVLLKSPGYTGLFCAIWIAHADGYSVTLEPETRPHTAVRVRLWQLLYCILFGSVLFAAIEDPYDVLCWFCVVYGVVYVIFFLRKGDNGAEPWTATFMMLWMLLTLGAFLLVVHPITVSQAQSIVEQAGYTDCVYYKVDADGNLAHEDGRPDGAIIYVPSPESAERSEYYAFSAVKGKEEYGILISRFRGTIDVEQKRGV